MLGALGIEQFEPAALERSLLVKGATESLASSLLNLAEIDAAFGNVSCLRAMLRSETPERFGPGCGDAWDGLLGAHS